MNLIASFFAWIFDPQQANAQDLDDKYLADAVDICDLERRMRAIDERRPFGPFGQNA
jgi:hypothetical protein